MRALNTKQELPKKLLGWEGRLYPSDMKFYVHAPTLNDVRMWQSIDFEDVFHYQQSITTIIKNCVEVENGDVRDIYEHDKFAFLIAIFQKYNTENALTRNLFVHNVSCPHCDKEYEKLIVDIPNLSYKTPDDKYIDLVNKDLGMFQFETKKYGVIEFKPSTIGVGEIVAEWAKDFKRSFLKAHPEVITDVQALITDWRGLTVEGVRKLQIETYNLMSGAHKLFLYQLVEKLNITLEGRLSYTCDSCGAGFRCALPIEQFGKTMFEPVSSFDDELL